LFVLFSSCVEEFNSSVPAEPGQTVTSILSPSVEVQEVTLSFQSLELLQQIIETLFKL
jgi:hypothetical protein